MKIFTQNKILIFVVFLWLMIWGTYNTDIFRMFLPDFPHNALDLIHGLRSLLPFIALIIATIIILIKKEKLFTCCESQSSDFWIKPMGLILIYVFIGILSSTFSNHFLMALYWDILYGIVGIVILTIMTFEEPLKKILLIIKINWIIAAFLAVALVAFFLIQPGALESLTLNFLVCQGRAYEGFGGVSAAVDTFGMAGTRPTGLGRYAGLASLVVFCIFLSKKDNKQKILWFLLFAFFLMILLFSKGKTEILGFIAAGFLALFLSKKIKIIFITILATVTLLAGIVIFYNIPCTNSTNYLEPIFSLFSKPKAPLSPLIPEKKDETEVKPEPVQMQTPVVVSKPKENQISSSPPVSIELKVGSIKTLSGRTNGVWADSWNLFVKNPLFGFGFQADRFFLDGQHAHNTLLHALVQTGLLGTIPLLFAFFITVIYLFRLFRNPNILEKEKNFLIILISVFAFFLIRGLTESLAFFSADWLFVAPIIAYIQCLDVQLKNRKQNIKRVDFSGIKFDTVKISEVLEKILFWVKNEKNKFHQIVVTGMHGIVEASRHSSFKYIINSADLFVPDGISLVWLARLKGFKITERVSGTDLMQDFFELSKKENLKNFLYGDTNETLKKISEKFTNVDIDFYSPPFRELTPEEDEKIIKKINNSNADILWVGLGLPKQEKWIFDHKEKLNVPVVIGVGAAFKFLSGRVKRAPKWIGNLGLEWLWRLIHEPKIIWKRVFIDGPIFLWLVFKDLFT